MNDQIFTLENIKTGAYRTFKLETMGAESKFAPGEQVISLLTGPANRHDYQGFGFVHDAISPQVKVWKSKQGLSGEKSELQKIAVLLGMFWNDLSGFGSKYRLYDPAPCSRCGELLTVPRSIRLGLGPYCARQD